MCHTYSMKNTDTTYRIIGFGDNAHGFFNQFHWSSNTHEALLIYSDLVEDPEMDGAVLIEVQHETWQVTREFGSYPYSVECGPVGNLKVTKSENLVLN